MTSPRILVVGTGYVGLVTAVCMANLGFYVHGVDANAETVQKLSKGEVHFYEPGLESLLKQNLGQGRLTFGVSLEAARDADVIFIAVGTPSGQGGEADLSQVEGVIGDLAPYLKDDVVVILKSTVPIGTNRAMAQKLKGLTDKEVHMVSNPEFLREGQALSDFTNPDRIIVGSMHPTAEAALRRLYKFFADRQVPMLMTSWETAEMIKYAANSFLATKISFINELALLCERMQADVSEVALGMGLDRRIGRDFLRPGPGYGGSCFPKDTRALVHSAHEVGGSLSILEAVVRSNDAHKEHMVQKIQMACGGSVNQKIIGVLGVTFKAETDDVREGPALTIVPMLQKEGANVRIFDPKANPVVSSLLPGIQRVASLDDLMEGADALVVMTEWDVFKTLDFQQCLRVMKAPVVVDLRNLYTPRDVPEGITYVGLGRGR